MLMDAQEERRRWLDIVSWFRVWTTKDGVGYVNHKEERLEWWCYVVADRAKAGRVDVCSNGEMPRRDVEMEMRKPGGRWDQDMRNCKNERG